MGVVIITDGRWGGIYHSGGFRRVFTRFFSPGRGDLVFKKTTKKPRLASQGLVGFLVVF